MFIILFILFVSAVASSLNLSLLSWLAKSWDPQFTMLSILSLVFGGKSISASPLKCATSPSILPLCPFSRYMLRIVSFIHALSGDVLIKALSIIILPIVVYSSAHPIMQAYQASGPGIRLCDLFREVNLIPPQYHLYKLTWHF